MAGSVLNVHAHDGVLAAHALRAKADGVDAVFQQLLHIGCALVLVVAAQRTHQSLLGQQSGGLNRGGNAHAHQQRRAGVDAVAGHDIHDEPGHAFVACTGHQNHSLARQGAAAACHVGVDLALVAVRDDIPPHGGSALADIAAGVELIESFNAVVAQGCFEGSLDHSLLQQTLHLADEGEVHAALYPELQHTGVLAAGAVQLLGQFLVPLHGLIDDLGQRSVLLCAQLIELGNDVVRQHLGDMAHKVCHIGRHLLHLFLFVHSNASLALVHFARWFTHIQRSCPLYCGKNGNAMGRITMLTTVAMRMRGRPALA